MTAIKKDPSAYVETEVDGESVLMSLADGKFYSLRESGQSIWAAIDGNRDGDAIADAVAGEYGVERDIVAGDVAAFLAALMDAGLVTD